MATNNLTDPIAFTWSPNPSMFNGILPKFQHWECIHVLRLLNRCCATYQIYPELNLEGNIHYHGILYITDRYKWYHSVLPSFRYKGFVKIKLPGNLTGWTTYCEKDKELMSNLLGHSLPLEKTDPIMKSIRKTKCIPCPILDAMTGGVGAPGTHLVTDGENITHVLSIINPTD